MNTLADWLESWQQADAVSIFDGALIRWTDDRARSLYMSALIPSWEGR